VGNIKPFLIGFMTATLIAACMFANALYSGSITRGEAIQDVEQYLPRVVREMPFKKASGDRRIEQALAGDQ
jgi:hypothetical protein